MHGGTGTHFSKCPLAVGQPFLSHWTKRNNRHNLDHSNAEKLIKYFGSVTDLEAARRRVSTSVLRPWFSARTRCVALSALDVSHCPKRGSSVIVSSDGGVCTRPLWRRGSWARRQISQWTSPSTFWSSPAVMTFGSWPMEWERAHKWTKWASFVGWLRLSLCGIGEKSQTSGGSSE